MIPSATALASPLSPTNKAPAALVVISAYQAVRRVAASTSTALNSADDFAWTILIDVDWEDPVALTAAVFSQPGATTARS